MGIITHGYKSILKRKRFRFQLYYPEIRILNNDLMFRVDFCFRVVWKQDFCIAFTCIFGIGFMYYREADNEKV